MAGVLKFLPPKLVLRLRDFYCVKRRQIDWRAHHVGGNLPLVVYVKT
jgi:hypothetical protein